MAKQVPSGKYLLKKNAVAIDEPNVDVDAVANIIKQKPNKKFNLLIYNSVKPANAQKRIVAKQIRIGKRNMRRMSKGRDSIPYRASFQEWKLYTVGEPPVVLDTSLVRKSRDQISLYMGKVGYFHNHVTVEMDTAITLIGKKKKQQITVKYNIEAGPAHPVRELIIECSDERLLGVIQREIEEVNGNVVNRLSEIKIGEPLNLYTLDSERSRLTARLKDNAYWKFTQDYITYNADTTKFPGEVILTMIIHPVKVKDPIDPTIVTTRKHKQFKVRNVTFVTDFVPGESKVLRDTLFHLGPDGQEHYILYKDELTINPDVLIQSNFLRPKNWWKQKYVERSYKRLIELGMFRNVTVDMRAVENSDPAKVDIVYFLSTTKRKSFTLSTDGTNNGGFFGIQGSLNYTDKNAFGNAENLTFSLEGGFEQQQSLTDDATQETTEGVENVLIESFNGLNTIEFGPKITLTIPKFLFIPVPYEKQSRSAMPFTVASAALNFQKRPDYTREIITGSFGYKWYETKTKTHEFSPVEVSLVKIDKSPAFQLGIDTSNDFLLQNSFQDHLILAPKYTFTYNSQLSPKIKDRSNRYYYRGTVELGGNLLRLAFEASGQTPDSADSYNLFNIRFAHYILIDNEFRFYRTFSEKHSLATRFAAGVGVPLSNNPTLPFEKSFFSGGANGMRAWKARSLGPGAYFEPNQTYDKLGDIRLESSVEYRFKMISFIEGAFFVDAGNIWLINEDSIRVDGEFQLSNFANQIAIGGGFGTRFDFSFLIVRLDLALPLKNPALPRGERWIWQDTPIYDTQGDNVNRFGLNFNLGIGYPF